MTVLLAVLCSSALLVGCGGGDQATTTTAKVIHMKFDPANFGDPDHLRELARRLESLAEPT